MYSLPEVLNVTTRPTIMKKLQVVGQLLPSFISVNTSIIAASFHNFEFITIFNRTHDSL